VKMPMPAPGASFDSLPEDLEVGQSITLRYGDYGFQPGLNGSPVGKTFALRSGMVEITSETLSNVDACWTLKRIK
jgi:hypothetical protein